MANLTAREVARPEPLESALRKRDDFALGAIFDALESARDAEQSQSRDAGNEISRPLSAIELAERVRRILENPILADAERDDRVLQAVEERREELGLAEPARQDDAPPVEYSQEPEMQSTADRDAAEIDYLFGRPRPNSRVTSRQLDEHEAEPFETATRDPGNYFEPVIAWCKISATSG